MINTEVSMPSFQTISNGHTLFSVDCSMGQSCDSVLFERISARSISLLCTGDTHSCRFGNFTFRGGEETDIHVDINCNGVGACHDTYFDILSLNYGDGASTSQSIDLYCGDHSNACERTILFCVPIFQSEWAHNNSMSLSLSLFALCACVWVITSSYLFLLT